jgi:hypothetical protein
VTLSGGADLPCLFIKIQEHAKDLLVIFIILYKKGQIFMIEAIPENKALNSELTNECVGE